MKFSLRSLRAGHNSRERLQAIATNNVKRDKRCCGNRLIKKVRLPWAEPFACPAEAKSFSRAGEGLSPRKTNLLDQTIPTTSLIPLHVVCGDCLQSFSAVVACPKAAK